MDGRVLITNAQLECQGCDFKDCGRADVLDQRPALAYHPQDDASEKVQFVGATDGAQTDQYFFGRNQLPGYGTGDAATNSVWTVPVYATAANQPC